MFAFSSAGTNLITCASSNLFRPDGAYRQRPSTRFSCQSRFYRQFRRTLSFPPAVYGGPTRSNLRRCRRGWRKNVPSANKRRSWPSCLVSKAVEGGAGAEGDEICIRIKTLFGFLAFFAITFAGFYMLLFHSLFSSRHHSSWR